MKVRSLLIATALVSSILGAVVAYLVLRQARDSIKAGRNSEARSKLSHVVQQYPRTDAAAAATVALAELEDAERQKLAADLAKMRREAMAQKQELDGLTQKVNQLTSAPAPESVTIVAPEPAQPPAKKAPAKKPARKKRRTRHRR
jgi:phosphate/sulfate permease